MKILYFWAEQKNYMDQWQRIHFFDELERINHTITVFNPLDYLSVEEANENLLRYIYKEHKKPNLFMTCVPSKLLYPETIKYIKSLGIPTLLICFDNLHAPYIHKDIAPIFDLVWITSRETELMFKKWGCKTVFMPYAANPYKYYPIKKEEIPAIGFVGTLYGARLNKIQNLTNNHLKCNIYSNSKTSIEHNYNVNSIKTFIELSKFSIGRKIITGALLSRIKANSSSIVCESDNLKLYPSVNFEEMISLYSNLSISLGVTELRNTYLLNKPIHKLHLRTFEIPMSGGLQLASYSDELASYFENDKEIILYHDDEEMISKSKFYIREDNYNLRLKMKHNAHKRAINEHTWKLRFNSIFNML